VGVREQKRLNTTATEQHISHEHCLIILRQQNLERHLTSTFTLRLNLQSYVLSSDFLTNVVYCLILPMRSTYATAFKVRGD
jgi:hypothetical protein